MKSLSRNLSRKSVDLGVDVFKVSADSGSRLALKEIEVTLQKFQVEADLKACNEPWILGALKMDSISLLFKCAALSLQERSSA